jgi:integrase
MATVRGSSLRQRHRHRHRRSSLMEARISWGVMERATGIEPARSVTMHGLRHAYTSWLLAGGADLHVMKERLGHAKTTTEGYLHTLPSADETAFVLLSAPSWESGSRTNERLRRGIHRQDASR